MTFGELLNVFSMYLLCFINVLIWNNWCEGADACWASRTWNWNWFFWLTGDVVTRLRGELFCMYLVLFIYNKLIQTLIEGLEDVWCGGWEVEIEFKFNFLNLVMK